MLLFSFLNRKDTHFVSDISTKKHFFIILAMKDRK